MFGKDFKDMETKEIIIPDGWEIEKIVDNKVILKENKNRLPKTWEECVSKLTDGEFVDASGRVITLRSIFPTDSYRNTIPIGLGKSILALCQLLVCREIYRQGWKPDWTEQSIKYCILNRGSEIVSEEYKSIKCTLSFQSEEVRDQFLANFYDLIEDAKELL